MNIQEAELWEKIRSYQIGYSEASFSFSDRLARENDWELKYALRVIHEYKRFIFLICLQNEPMTPSEQVDQAWHLHLLYTKDYWEDFCGKVLKKNIHHGPTRGGNSEKVKYFELYQNTQKFYEQVFREKPPVDIWPSEKDRFSRINFVRVSKDDFYIIPKNFIKNLKKWMFLKN